MERERIRLEAADRFAQGEATAVAAAALRVGERQVRKWRQAWRDGGSDALRSKRPRLPRRHGWTAQAPVRRALERDDAAVEVWKSEVWPRLKGPRRCGAGTT